MNDYNLHQHRTADWMSNTPAMDNLSLLELILPGAHNAGVDSKASYLTSQIKHWIVCQNDSFFYQLNNGARALDVRVEYEIDSRGVGTFWFQHNGYRSSRSLENLVMQVIRFLQENPDEFVLLDFHELKSTRTPFDYKEFNRFMLTHLGQRIIPSRHESLSLGQLKKASRKQRVWVATQSHPELSREWFISKVDHEWSHKSLTSVEDVEALIERATYDKRNAWSPWSLSATAYSVLGGPEVITGHLDRWFDPDANGWVFNCNIINADFFEKSRLVSNCRTANIIKAGIKSPR
jgi:1-phosphatidylinositol phosphodiesterase